jgi:hypothetical protein
MDPIKKVAEVVNEYLTDFFESINQLPTKDMSMVRQIVGQWPLVKQLMKSFTVQAMKSDLDKDYIKAVFEDFKKSSALLDKLESHYKGVLEFDLEGIKTHAEPLIKMMEKMKGDTAVEESAVAPVDEAPVPEEEPVTKEAFRASMIDQLDKIATELETEFPQIALAVDKLSDTIEKKEVL